MLKRIGEEEDVRCACVPIRDASFPAPFRSGLEYSAAARGTWNIVHTGMLIPGAHEIFVCAPSCLRGVVLTAAEMGASHRFSTVTIQEHNVLEGDMEELLIDGVTDILHKLPKRPSAVLVYTSCIHHFIGCDLKRCYQVLRERFPGLPFTDCYMNPIMRKSGLTPDEIMRRQLYSLLERKPLEARSINLVGNDLPTEENSDLVQIIRKAGWTFREITRCKTYGEYQEMAGSAYSISTQPAARAGGDWIAKTYGQTHLFLPLSYTSEGIDGAMDRLAEVLGVDWSAERAERVRAVERAVAHAREVIGDTAIAIDYTATPAPLSLARFLIESGFRVERIYVDGMAGVEKEDFLWLQHHVPELELCATVQVKMRVLRRQVGEPILAVGQKAAYFTGTKHFVNMIEGGGMYGYDGVCRLLERMEDAFLHEKETESCIQQKGLGCACCL